MHTALISIPCLLTGGTEIQTLNLVRALVSGGYRVVTVCYYEYAEAMVAQYCAAGSEVELLSPEGKRCHGWRQVGHLYRGFRRCVKKYRPAVAHVQYMAPGALPCILLKWLGVPRIFATAHTDARIYRSLRLVHFIRRHVVDVFTCITERAEKEFFGSSQLYHAGMALPRHAHVTIYNALPEHIELRETPRKELPNTPTIGVVSRLEEIKGMDLVIPAFAQLLAQCPQARLLIVGDGSLRGKMEGQAQEFGVHKHIEWAGRQDQSSLQAFYDRIDLFWMPSRSEGFGLSALEAMACSCPVVASDVGGLPELLEEGKTGVLIPSGDIKALARASLAILSDSQQCQRLSCAALDRAAQFTADEYQRLICDLYRKEVACIS